VWLERGEAARLFSRDRQAGLLEQDAESLKAQIALKDQTIRALTDLVAIEKAKAQGRADLAQIEGERRAAWERRAHEAEGKNRFYRTLAGAGTGAAAGSVGGPIGMGAGALIGALFGFFFQ
jgi:hypothetical protein